MSQPKEITYDLGPDAYGRRTSLVWRAAPPASRPGWTIIRDAGDQRDERESVALLTDAQLTEIGAIAAEHRRK